MSRYSPLKRAQERLRWRVMRVRARRAMQDLVSRFARFRISKQVVLVQQPQRQLTQKVQHNHRQVVQEHFYG